MTNPFSPIRIGTMELKNRFVRSATYDYFGNLDGTISEREFEIINQLASNDVGTIITALMSISPFGLAEREQNRIDQDSYIEGLRKACDITHHYGAKIIVQLCHAGGKANPEDNGNLQPLSASEMLMPSGIVTRAMTLDEIQILIEDFVSAAKRAYQAGADGVQIHGAHGYLLSQFVSFIDNKRLDQYGGSAENRFRILREIKEKIAETISGDYPVWLKINSNIKGDISDNTRYLTDLIEMIKIAKECGYQVIEMSGTGFALLKGQAAPYFINQVSAVKKQVDIPIAIVGGIRTLQEIDIALDAEIELISLSRPFITEPDLLHKFKQGSVRSRCLHCQKCFDLPKTKNVRCVFQTTLK